MTGIITFYYLRRAFFVYMLLVHVNLRRKISDCWARANRILSVKLKVSDCLSYVYCYTVGFQKNIENRFGVIFNLFSYFCFGNSWFADIQDERD